MTFADWLAANPFPSLTELIERHGSFAQVPPHEWTRYDAAVDDWRWRYRYRHADEQIIPPGRRKK